MEISIGEGMTSDTVPIRYRDKVLPTQHFFSSFYEGASYENALAEMTLFFAESYSAEKFTVIKPKHIDFEEMSSTPAMLGLLGFVIKLTKAKRALEIGTFVGNTTMHLAFMMGEDSHIDTIEVGQEFADIARRNFVDNSLSHRIAVHCRDTNDVLTGLKHAGLKYDFIFIDGGKESYLQYATQCEALLSPNGIIAIDDVFFHGDALNDNPRTDKGNGCKQLLGHYQSRKDIAKLLLPFGNGILFLFRTDAAG